MNNSGRFNSLLVVFGVMVLSVAALVLAAAPIWTGSDVNYTALEDTAYYHNLSENITNLNNDISFAIDTQTNISWTYPNGTTSNVSYNGLSEWIYISDSSTGNLTIYATYDNQTGFFVVPIQATNTTDWNFAGTNFEFNISAVNDAPQFSGLENQSFPVGTELTYEFNVIDEDESTPYNFTMEFINCSVADWSDRDCDTPTGRELFDSSYWDFDNVTGAWNLTFTPVQNDVGVYVINMTVVDNSSLGNQSYNQIVNFTVENVNVFPYFQYVCDDGKDTVEDSAFSCWINASDVDETNNLTFTIEEGPAGFVFSNGLRQISSACNLTTAFNSSAQISFTANDSMVGNWSINISVTDTDSSSQGYNSTGAYFFINNTEDNVTMDAVADFSAYENITFELAAYDDDLYVNLTKSATKNEYLTFTSNNSNLVHFGSGADSITPSRPAGNSISPTVYVDYTYAVDNAIGSAVIKINVTDRLANSETEYYSVNETVFTITFSSDEPPVWDVALETPVDLELTEDVAFVYNVSKNVTDADAGDTITFIYQNVSKQFCSLNASTFNSTSGIISFTPTDCDVGYHNVTIIASDSYVNVSKQFNFTVSNVVDTPEIAEPVGNTNVSGSLVNGSSVSANEDNYVTFDLDINDDDLLIPSGQQSFYNESFSVDTIFTNSTGDVVTDLFNFDFYVALPGGSQWTYVANFTPSGAQVDNYTVSFNVTDAGGANDLITFGLNVTATGDFPELELIENQVLIINETLILDINATDEEDSSSLPENGNLAYVLDSLTTGGDFLSIGYTTGEISLVTNSSHAGLWEYNVTVNDTDGNIDFQAFNVTIYGLPVLVSPSENSAFDLTENATALLNFSINHSVGDNLTYEFWIDTINCSYSNSSNCSYGNFSLKGAGAYFGNGSSFGWSFLPNFTDETYENYKNLTVSVFPNSSSINSTQKEALRINFSYRLNISHANHPPTVYSSFGSHSGTYGSSAPVNIILTENFIDYDYLDPYYKQEVTFTISSSEANSVIRAQSYDIANRLTWNGTISNWLLNLYGEESSSEYVTISANDSVDVDTSDPFSVSFSAPSVTTTPAPSSGGSGTTTKLKHYSLKLIVPQEVRISDQNYIDIPFAVQNNGQIDLRGIDLSSFVRFNDAFSSDVKVSLGDSYIEELSYGQSENFSMRITANTQRAGRYKATILANVTSPKFSDWGEFFIDLRKTNETEAEQILLFTEKFVAENAECLEFTELLIQAQRAFDLGEYSNSLRLAKEVTEACEDAIGANEQIRYGQSFIKENFYYISFTTLVIFFIGFVFYIYKRVRFNKSKMDDYV